MLTLLTSCNRHDLLKETIESLPNDHELDIKIHEDSMKLIKFNEIKSNHRIMASYSVNEGQHKSIEKFLEKYNKKYYLHLEDDWIFENTYDWISLSMRIMEFDPTVIKVIASFDTPHPCNHNCMLDHTNKNSIYGYLEKWTGRDGIQWNGFSWNPGLTRMDLLKKFMPFPKYEQDLARQIYDAGYHVVELKFKVYKHIGYGRSTH